MLSELEIKIIENLQIHGAVELLKLKGLCNPTRLGLITPCLKGLEEKRIVFQSGYKEYKLTELFLQGMKDGQAGVEAASHDRGYLYGHAVYKSAIAV